ncbi:MAG: hypothetical protein JSR98_04510 [Proteobacteria bacterium]|nr:hypothetical protein [Pseudomonadota bacterium]
MHEAFVFRQNIEHLSRLLGEAREPAEAQLLQRLLTDERRRLAGHGRASAPATPDTDGRADLR